MQDGPRYSTVEMLDRLVSFDTTSRNSNLDLIEWVRSYLAAHGVTARLSFNAAGDKANLHAIIGPQRPGGIALSGHVDVVPVDGQEWSSAPFGLREAGGRLYGRGTCDMKGFVAACLAAVPDFLAMGLARPIHLLITYDEETNCSGAGRLVEDLTESGLKPDYCIVGEPSGMQPIVAHKSRLAVRVTATGTAGHSSQPARGVNTILAMGHVLGWVEAESARFAEHGPFAAGFDPPHSTVHIGTITGGTVLNIIPARTDIVMEWRTVPQDDALAELARLEAHVAATVEPAMRRIHADAGFTFHVDHFIPGLALPPEHALADLLRQLTGSNTVGHVSYATEAGLYQKAGMPAIICGPGHIAQAHQPDEFVALSELAACDAFIRRAARKLVA